MTDYDNLIPSTGLEFWHEADLITGVADGDPVTSVPDRSTKGRTLACASSNPLFDAEALNGLPGVVFSGSNNPLAYTGSFTLKHLFIAAAYADAAFPSAGGAGEYAGLFSGVAGGNLVVLCGNPTDTKFFNNGYNATFGGYEYRIRSVQHLEGSQTAPMSGGIALIEVRFAPGFSLDGIQVGKDRTNANRKWKGPWIGDQGFSRVISDAEVDDVYEWWGIKYQLWMQNAAGLDVWPFQPNWSRPLAVDKPVLSSMSVDRSRKSRTKGSMKKAVELHFENRGPEEYDAAVEFWDSKYPGTPFIYRDKAFTPARDTEMEFTSGIVQQADDTRDIPYSFKAEEV